MGYSITYTKVDASGEAITSSASTTFNYNSTVISGVSMVGAEIDVNGNLIISMSDGSTIDAGAIQSQGSNVDWGNVVITGGSINGTVIGNVTPAAGSFTTIDSATVNGGYF